MYYGLLRKRLTQHKKLNTLITLSTLIAISVKTNKTL